MSSNFLFQFFRDLTNPDGEKNILDVSTALQGSLQTNSQSSQKSKLNNETIVMQGTLCKQICMLESFKHSASTTASSKKKYLIDIHQFYVDKITQTLKDQPILLKFSWFNRDIKLHSAQEILKYLTALSLDQKKRVAILIKEYAESLRAKFLMLKGAGIFRFCDRHKETHGVVNLLENIIFNLKNSDLLKNVTKELKNYALAEKLDSTDQRKINRLNKVKKYLEKPEDFTSLRHSSLMNERVRFENAKYELFSQNTKVFSFKIYRNNFQVLKMVKGNNVLYYRINDKGSFVETGIEYVKNKNFTNEIAYFPGDRFSKRNIARPTYEYPAEKIEILHPSFKLAKEIHEITLRIDSLDKKYRGHFCFPVILDVDKDGYVTEEIQCIEGALLADVLTNIVIEWFINSMRDSDFTEIEKVERKFLDEAGKRFNLLETSLTSTVIFHGIRSRLIDIAYLLSIEYGLAKIKCELRKKNKPYKDLVFTSLLENFREAIGALHGTGKNHEDLNGENFVLSIANEVPMVSAIDFRMTKIDLRFFDQRFLSSYEFDVVAKWVDKIRGSLIK
jgi:hypothetical protein